MRVAIIGGGLAGTACAYFLKQEGMEPVIYEASGTLAAQASGNPAGLYNPRLLAEKTDESAYFSAAFFLALEHFKILSDAGHDIGWRPCGALHLANDDKKVRRFGKMLENRVWPDGFVRPVTREEAGEIAGVAVACGGVYLPLSGAVSPRLLCAAYASGTEVRLGSPVEDLKDIEADAVILACGAGIRNFSQASGIRLGSVRGQVTFSRETPYSSRLRTALCYGGYCIPSMDGIHCVGATFQRWLDHTETLPGDDARNIAELGISTPDFISGMAVAGSRAALRITTPDHLPVAGALPGQKDIYTSGGHGSHGILGSLISARIVTDMIAGKPSAVPDAIRSRLSPARFG